MTTVAISVGHGERIRGARGSPVPPQCDEVDEAKKIVDRVAALLGCVKFFDTTSTSQSANLSAITSWHNKQSRDLDVSVHWNAYDHSAHGTEVLYVTQEALADDVCHAICEALGTTFRGAKYRSDLAFLNNTNKPAILIETAFCDNTGDCNLYHAEGKFEALCRAIAESISGQSLPDQPPEQPPEVEVPPDTGEPPAGPVTGTVHGLVAGDQLNIRASASSGSPIIGQAENNDLVTIVGSAHNADTLWYKLKWGDSHMAGVAVFGWASAAYIEPEGEVPEAESEWHTAITATEFGEGSDEQEGAYGEWIDGDTRGVSFPYKWRDQPRPMVEVAGPGGSVVVGVVDVGPWNTDDPAYVLGTERPLAESQYEDQTEAQNGMVPSNPAGIDLTAPIAREVGISGKGRVNWRLAPAGATMSVASLAKPKHKAHHRHKA
jgi:hypothetical protein